MKKISSGTIYFLLFFIWNNIAFCQSTRASDNVGGNYLIKAKHFSDDINIDSAEYYYLKAIEKFEQKNLWDSVIVSYIRLSVDMLASDNYESAKESIDEAMETCKQHEKHQHLLADIHIKHSDIYRELEADEKAESHLDSARLVIPKIEGITQKKITEIALNYGYSELEYKKEEYDKSLTFIEKVVADAMDMNNKLAKDYIMECYNLRGTVYLEKGKYEEAFKWFHRVEIDTINRKKKHEFGILTGNIAYTNWAYGKTHSKDTMNSDFVRVYFNLDSVRIYFNKAIEDYKQAIKYIENTVGIHHTLAQEYNNYAMVYDDIYIYEGHDTAYTKSHHLYSKSLKYRKATQPPRHPDIARNYMNIGALYYEHKDYDKALENLHETLRLQIIGFDDKDTSALPYIGNDIIDANRVLYALKKKAAVFIGIYETSGDINDLILALNHIKFCVSIIAKIRHTYTSDEAKLGFIARESGLVVRVSEIANLLFQETGEQSYLEDALDLILKLKSILLYEIVQRREALSYSDISPDLKSEERALRNSLSELKSSYIKSKEDSRDSILGNYINVRESYHELLDIIEKEHPVFFENKYRLPNFLHSQITDKFLISKPNTLIIEYVVDDEFIYTFGISSKKISINKITRSKIEIGTDSLVNIVRGIDTKRRVDNKDIKSFATNAFNLYENLLTPILDSFKTENIEKLIIIPDNFLNNIPFDCLLSDLPADNLNYIDLPYLLKDYTFSYLPSLSLLTKIYEIKQKRKHDIIGFAPGCVKKRATDTIYNYVAKTKNCEVPLRFAKEEVTFLEKNFGADIFTGSNASETQFKEHAPNYDIIHIAAHALIDNQVPENSKFIFSNIDSVDDGELELWEIYQMNLNASLAFLAACETGIGKTEKGEGVMSLARSFFVAGCSSVMMSLWKVSDEKTSLITKKFYAYLGEGYEKDEALQAAKLDYIIGQGNENSASRSHPYYWAGVVCMGDTKTIYNKDNSYFYFMLLSLFLFVIAMIWYYKISR